ncbi:hypothetical protein [Methanolobus profundi]|uniref:hypothetical protein n=1 Tax=Methanolobus profundi TaxID=487685 RepID=UPI000B829AFA|nr:hypothetical protein [Methanolobus profundi]
MNLLFIENCTIQEAGDKLGVDQRSIRDRLLMLEHMGYIKEVCNNSKPKSSACCSCSAASSCSSEGGDTKGKAYQLTEKGEKICRS